MQAFQGIAKRRKRSAARRLSGSRSVSYYRRTGGTIPKGPRGGKETPFHEPLGGNMTGTPRPEPVSTKQQRIAELARNCPDMAFTNLAHHIDIIWLHKAHALTRKDGAVGVDDRPRRTTRPTCGATFRISSTARSPARTWLRPCDECTSPRRARLPRLVHWEYPHMRIKSSSVRPRWCWSRSTRRTSWTPRTVSGPDGELTEHWGPCGNRQ
jgi:hypothetical protein